MKETLGKHVAWKNIYRGDDIFCRIIWNKLELKQAKQDLERVLIALAETRK